MIAVGLPPAAEQPACTDWPMIEKTIRQLARNSRKLLLGA